MNYTKNLRLNKPEYDEVVDIEKLNDNFDAIDAKLIQKATQSADGLLSATDKKKLDNIEDYANKIIVDTELSSSSTNPVQNKIVNDALDGKFPKSGGGISGDVTMLKRLDVKGAFEAHETILAKKDVQCLYDNGDSRIRIACASSDAAKITTDGAASYARMKIGSPTENDDATTKKYVDGKLDDKLSLSGGTMTGNLTGKSITGTVFKTTGSTNLNKTTSRVAVLDNEGIIHYRTITELFSDIVETNNVWAVSYPVGSIYMSTSSTSPATIFGGGTWEQIENRFLLAAGSEYEAGTTGGEAEHALELEEMPSHYHPIYAPNAGGAEEGAALGFPTVGDKKTWWIEASKTGVRGGRKGAKDGEARAHNNMPPYITVYVWKRTA